MVRNPSELQRLLEEDLERGLHLLEVIKVSLWKSVKEEKLRELRDIERRLGIESTPYNITEFYERSKDALLHLRRRINGE